MGRRSGRWTAAIAAAVIVVTCAWIGSGPAGAQPLMSVSPKLHLSKGDQVTVHASGLPPGTSARIVECDQFNDDVSLDCPDLASVPVNSKGSFTTSVALADPVFRSQPFGDGTPVYCRADVCRIFVVWPDSTGTNQVLSSQRLWFLGAPATIAVTPSSGLRQDQGIHAAGTAKRAQGHVVELVEEACFSLVQGSGCYGTAPPVKTRVLSDGTWSRTVPVHRFLADGTDCNDPDILGACQVTARIIGSDGQPDDTFGVSRIGAPGAPITFRS